ncbi:sulfite exporter TauE/SafE family protein [Lyngbya aestuarii BL J]|uniref:Probable membrane transporter protein n=1 Tax=Lyngbya aestuarii BL J TaxID=1348334 RepID=U7QD84_9CYAN|nr:TSUP family transporter [Lyngbya aestuarii]ERT05803.1 sulfite exporter TauE/SafE family protein [Lyngbya aestuarii BL J]
MVQMIAFLMLGLATGTISGLIGIGGGVLLTPALVYFFGFSQHYAQGTTLALLVPPIGLLAAWTYYQEGYVNIKVALLICIGFFLGGFLGGKLAGLIPELYLKRIFGVAMLIVGFKMILSK